MPSRRSDSDRDRNFNPRWWSRSFPASSLRLRAVLSGAEVARVEMDANPRPGPGDLGPIREIYSIEVSAAHRGQGIGGRVVQHLSERFNDARLIASTNEAVGWWTSLNWLRFNHPDLTGSWTAFVSPEH